MTVRLEKSRAGKILRFYAALGGALLLVAIAWKFYAFRREVRWLAWSQRYKGEVLAQPSKIDELKHIEWDGWGWAAQDTVVYLVFDPTNSLPIATREHRLGKLNGLPCEVYAVDRMEKNWYAVRFYTGEQWGRRNGLDCTGSGH